MVKIPGLQGLIDFVNPAIDSNDASDDESTDTDTETESLNTSIEHRQGIIPGREDDHVEQGITCSTDHRRSNEDHFVDDISAVSCQLVEPTKTQPSSAISSAVRAALEGDVEIDFAALANAPIKSSERKREERMARKKALIKAAKAKRAQEEAAREAAQEAYLQQVRQELGRTTTPMSRKKKKKRKNAAPGPGSHAATSENSTPTFETGSQNVPAEPDQTDLPLPRSLFPPSGPALTTTKPPKLDATATQPEGSSQVPASTPADNGDPYRLYYYFTPPSSPRQGPIVRNTNVPPASGVPSPAQSGEGRPTDTVPALPSAATPPPFSREGKRQLVRHTCFLPMMGGPSRQSSLNPEAPAYVPSGSFLSSDTAPWDTTRGHWGPYRHAQPQEQPPRQVDPVPNSDSDSDTPNPIKPHYRIDYGDRKPRPSPGANSLIPFRSTESTSLFDRVALGRPNAGSVSEVLTRYSDELWDTGDEGGDGDGDGDDHGLHESRSAFGFQTRYWDQLWDSEDGDGDGDDDDVHESASADGE